MMSFAPFVTHAARFKHKSEAEIARLTPSQRIDEDAEEQVHHRFDVLDDHFVLIEKYIRIDGLKALPRIIEIMDEYDPTRASGRRGHRGERFDAMWMLLGNLDGHVVRLRASEEGRSAMDALERAIGRMQAAGYGQKKDGYDWKHNRFESAVDYLKYAKGFNTADNAIRDTLRLEYKIILSDAELLELSNFLVAKYPEYPSWSETNVVTENTQLNGVRDSVRIDVLKKPERFYEAYLEFKKTT